MTYNLTRDPVFYITVVFFALMTTALPAVIGQPRMLPILQTLPLTFLVAVAVRRRDLRAAFTVMAIWLVVQLLTVLLLTLLLPGRVERTLVGGIELHAGLIEWLAAGSPLPAGLTVQPLRRAVEVVGVSIGSLVSGGLIGAWFLMRAVNLLGFFMGTILAAAEGLGGVLTALLPWELLRVAGLAGLVVLLAEPLLTDNWSVAYYVRERRRPLVVAVSLVIAGLVLELLLPAAWRGLFT